MKEKDKYVGATCESREYTGYCGPFFVDGRHTRDVGKSG